MKRGADPGAEPVAEAARALAGAMAAFEKLTVRVEEASLGSWEEIARAGQLLSRASEDHQEFLRALEALTGAVAEIRDRHNGCADCLGACAQRVDERRIRYQELQSRFAVLGTDARQIDAMLQSSAASEDPDVLRARLIPIQDRLAESVETAAALQAEAREAGIADLGRQASAIRRQLDGLLQAVVRVTGPEA